jgi:hypothetical protein
MATVRSISEKQIAANRSNARQSTGPKTEAGKQVSRRNAVTHGLLAQAVVITEGDGQEDPQAFAQLLEDLRAQYTPEGAAEDLEVETIALYYWRKMRAVRYEHGAIRKRTGHLREREESSREGSFDFALKVGSNLEKSSRGIQYLMGGLKVVRQQALDGTVPKESYPWLQRYFADKFTRPATTPSAEQTAAGPVAAQDDGRQLVATIDAEFLRLNVLRLKVAASEALQLDSKIRAAALPGPGVVDKLIRYETSNDRALDRALHRLESMQARRRQQGGTPAAQ